LHSAAIIFSEVTVRVGLLAPAAVADGGVAALGAELELALATRPVSSTW
jgi:hypothetical protein